MELNRNINSWANKQIWRITKIYQVCQPVINIIQFLLWGVIAIGINAWFELTFELFIIIIFSVLIGLNIIGMLLDKKGFFKEHKKREFVIQFPDVYQKQAILGAALYGRLSKMSISELDNLIEISSTFLGMSGLISDIRTQIAVKGK